MKKLTLGFALLFTLTLSAVFIYSSCTKDPCKTVTCLNGGTCNSGTCTCPTGYTGADCSIKDPCLGVTCLNGGTCSNGSCNCTPGYEGANCGTESRAKFLGVGTVTDNCSKSGTPTYVVTLTAGTAVTEINISNFWDTFTHKVVATVNGSSISIANQEPDSDGFTVSGSGTITGKVITLSYTVTETATSLQDICTSTTITLP